MVDFLKESLPQMPGAKLIKYVSRETGELPEITGGSKLKEGKFNKRGDAIMQEAFGYDRSHDLDWSDAQKAVDEYKAAKKQLADAQEAYTEAVQTDRMRVAELKLQKLNESKSPDRIKVADAEAER